MTNAGDNAAFWKIAPYALQTGARAAKAAEGLPDRRRHPRRHALKSALLVFRGGHCTMGCRILNTSPDGALLMPADVVLCPGEFVLRPAVGPARGCEVVWRKGDRLGVRYL
ncbi:MAG TPA: hypothetical protein VJ770_29295 [Stellaceae bacterium]|nr:hypothetical protein [Stellaceae bacterium]